MFKINLIMALLMLVLGIANTSYTAQVNISFEGTIDWVGAGTYSVGQIVSGVVIYDSETALTHSPTGSPPYTTNFNGAIDNFVIDGQQADYVDFNILAQTRYTDPIDYRMSFRVHGYDELTGLRERLDLTFRGPNLLNNIYQILEEPNFADMSSATFQYIREKLGWDGYVQESFYGNVNSLEVTIVPLPSAIWLFASGLIGIVGIRKKIRKA